MTTAEMYPGVRLTRPELVAWLDRKPPPRNPPRPPRPKCDWCEDGRVLVEGKGRDFGWWFETCIACADDESPHDDGCGCVACAGGKL